MGGGAGGGPGHGRGRVDAPCGRRRPLGLGLCLCSSCWGPTCRSGFRGGRRRRAGTADWRGRGGGPGRGRAGGQVRLPGRATHRRLQSRHLRLHACVVVCRPFLFVWGSSVGGWGVDKGAVWRPTMLPKAPTPPPAGAPTPGGGGAGSSKADKAAKKAEEAAARGPVRVRKEDLLKALLKKLTPYHAVATPSGQVGTTQCRLREGRA